MLLTISKYVGIIMRKNGICNSDEIEKVEYGTVVLLSTLIGFGSIFIIGLIFGKLLETLVFSLIFSILRSFTGGYHATTPLKCNLTYISCYLSTILFSEIFEKRIISNIIILLFSVISIFLFSPIENKNKRNDTYIKKRNKKFAVILTLIVLIIDMILYFFDLNMSEVINFTLFDIAILMIVVKYKERRKMRNEKNNA